MGGTQFDCKLHPDGTCVPGTTEEVQVHCCLNFCPDHFKIIASLKTGTNITGGGGFSQFHSRPDFQADVVQSYLQQAADSLPPPSTFNSNGRGFPGICSLLLS